MTHQNGNFNETTTNKNKNGSFLLPPMWCKNCDFHVLGDPLHGCHENDRIQKHRKYADERLANGT